ncbi:hypothetical protein CDAR_35861 [Caerostris darwini]|uniref:Uncharacterized protein n=1 Tax=Caerostris darwini TaxID=1538125 RepID=A0AAV4UXV0_9ARAC|nr:hypothetical protein CDAR_35861 [Caerostris darwini]
MSDKSDSDYESADFYPVMLPYPIRENVPTTTIHQRPLVVSNQPDRGPTFMQEQHRDVGVVSHDSLRLNRERAVLHRTQRTEDLYAITARLGLERLDRHFRNRDVCEYSHSSERSRNARGWRSRIRRFLSRIRSRARSVFRL